MLNYVVFNNDTHIVKLQVIPLHNLVYFYCEIKKKTEHDNIIHFPSVWVLAWMQFASCWGNRIQDMAFGPLSTSIQNPLFRSCNLFLCILRYTLNKSRHNSSFEFTLNVILCACYPKIDEKTHTFTFFREELNTLTILDNA